VAAGTLVGQLRTYAVRGAEMVAGGLFAAMFLMMVVQVVFRYFVGSPLKWTLELNLIIYIWVIFWGATFLIRERENVAFTLIYDAVQPQVRRILAAITTLTILVVYLVALPDNYEFVSFMKILGSPILDWRYDFVFSIFILYMVSVIAGSAMRLVKLLRQDWREDL